MEQGEAGGGSEGKPTGGDTEDGERGEQIAEEAGACEDRLKGTMGEADESGEQRLLFNASERGKEVKRGERNTGRGTQGFISYSF